MVLSRSTNGLYAAIGNYWTLNVDNNMKVDAVYTDIAKAFDSVSHLKLLLIRYKLMAFNRTYLNG